MTCSNLVPMKRRWHSDPMTTTDCLTTKVRKRGRRVRRKISDTNNKTAAMKLKELMSNTLPRTRKQRRSSTGNRQGVPNNPNTDNRRETTRGDNRQSFMNQESVTPESINSQKQNLSLHKPFKEEFRFDRNANLSPEYQTYDDPFEYIHYDSDGAYTLPKMRSRIKTNPWLPSPKSSPTASGMTSPLASSSEVESANQIGIFDVVVKDQTHTNPCVFSPSASMTESGFYSCGTPDASVYDDSQLKNGYFEKQKDLSHDFDSNYSGPQRMLFSSGIEEDNNISGHQGVFSDNVENIQSDSCFFPTDEDFQYEDIFERSVEECGTDIFGSNEDLLDVFESRDNLSNFDNESTDGMYYPSCTSADTQNEPLDALQNTGDFKMDIGNSIDCNYDSASMNMEQGVYFESADTEYRVHNVLEKCTIYPPINDVEFAVFEQENCSAKPTGSSVYNQTSNLQMNVKSHHASTTHYERLEYLKYLDNPCRFEQENVTNSELYTARDYSVYLRKKTSQFDVMHTNLQNKIYKLRRDKLLIDDLIRRAREEEEFKRQARMRMQSEANLAMKQVLLGTLRDLTERLESQTERLQSSYEQIITFQYQEAKCKQKT